MELFDYIDAGRTFVHDALGTLAHTAPERALLALLLVCGVSFVLCRSRNALVLALSAALYVVPFLLM